MASRNDEAAAGKEFIGPKLVESNQKEDCAPEVSAPQTCKGRARASAARKPRHRVKGKRVSSPTTMSCRQLVALVITAAALLPLSACADKKGAKQGPPPSVPVTVATVLQKDVPVQVTSIGTVEPFSAVAIK